MMQSYVAKSLLIPMLMRPTSILICLRLRVLISHGHKDSESRTEKAKGTKFTHNICLVFLNSWVLKVGKINKKS